MQKKSETINFQNNILLFLINSGLPYEANSATHSSVTLGFTRLEQNKQNKFHVDVIPVNWMFQSLVFIRFIQRMRDHKIVLK